jgi:hypothetical protein
MLIIEIIACYLLVEFNHTMMVIFTQKRIRDWKPINEDFVIKK